jgi:hypothetical protein
VARDDGEHGAGALKSPPDHETEITCVVVRALSRRLLSER